MKRNLMTVLCVAVAVSIFAASPAAWLPRGAMAQGLMPEGGGFMPGERARSVLLSCAPDYQRHCRDVPPGGGRILRCLSRHADLVSQRCFQALTAWGLTAVNAFKMCLPDVAVLCPGVPPHSGPALACLQRNADKLSQACRDSLADQELLNAGPEPRR